MKIFKKGFFFLSTALTATALVSCGNKDDNKNDTSSIITTTNEDFDYEIAINNLVKNIEANNYVVSGNDIEINVSSSDLVSFEYGSSKQNKDFVAMSVNDEVFQAYPNDDNLEWLVFVQYGNAVQACAKQAMLLNYMTNIFGGNMFDAFTSLPNEAGLYVSHETSIKEMIKRIGSYSDLIYASMEDVYLKIDDENASSAKLSVHVYNQTARYDFDIELDITFGNAKKNSLADSWMKNPTYPDNPPTWTYNQVGAIDMVFNLWPTDKSGIGVPFPQGASYALYLNPDLIMNGFVYIEDRHMTEQGVNNYIDILKNNGFVESQDEEGDTCYRKLLRDESSCYSSIYVDYNDGLELLAEEYFEFEHKNNLGDINAQITLDSNGGYPALENNNGIISVDAIDYKMREYEAYVYLNEYDLVYFVDIEYNDDFDPYQYIDEYISRLEESGFIFINSEADPRYSKSNGDINFRYNIDIYNNVINMKFKTNKRYSLFEVNQVLDYYPDILLGNDLAHYSAKSAINHQLIIFSKSYNLYFELDAYFNSEQAAMNFIDNYLSNLNDAGFYNVPNAGTGRTYEYVNDDGYIYGFDIVPIKNNNEVAVMMTFARYDN